MLVCFVGNQFRALEEDEVLFLDSILEKQREEERLRKETEGEELKNFRECVSSLSFVGFPTNILQGCRCARKCSKASACGG